MIEIGSALDPGRARKADKNQDALCVIQPDTPPAGPQPPLVVIADGMGGYEGGAVASQAVIAVFSRVYLQSAGSAPEAVLKTCVAAAQAELKDQAGRDPALARMGSTVVAAIVTKTAIALANVGDSRAYLINAHAARQISYDHSLVNEQLRKGIIDEDEARQHPYRNVLLMSLNAQSDEVEPYEAVVDWRPGDCLVLCSDGLWGTVTDQQIQAIVLAYPPQQAAEALVALANNNSGPDNIAVIVARNA